MFAPQLKILLYIICSWTIPGCGDRVRTTLQPVHIEVTDRASGRPVVGARVCLKFDFDKVVPPTDQSPNQREYARQLLWHFGVTDERGRTTVNIKYTAIDWTMGPWPPRSRDSVSGQPHIARVEQGDLQEQLCLKMRSGASVRGRHFAVSVLEVGQPRYVRTD